MYDKQLKIADNMVALARKKKGKGNSRSLMLKMIMPMLSNEHGERLAKAIETNNVHSFNKVWDEIKHDVDDKLNTSHRKIKRGYNVAHASSGAELEDLHSELVNNVFRKL